MVRLHHVESTMAQPATPGQEVEFKLRVPDGEALEALGRAAGGEPLETVLQVNHFLDTAARHLDRARFTLRLRDEDGRFFLTVKAPLAGGVGGALSRKAEEEVETSPAVAKGILEGSVLPLDVLAGAPGGTDARAQLVAAVRAATGGEPVRHVGAFQNRRTRWPARLRTPGGHVDVVLELDRTTFPGNVTHHEVEVEVGPGASPADVEEGLQDLFQRAGVTGSPSSSKAGRFFAALDGRPF
jgi:uncharacterized protein YjbK